MKGMSSLESIYEKMTPGNGSTSFAALHPQPPASESSLKISREVAHELNNILTIVRGYADRLVMKHVDNPALRPELKLIADNARRAANVIRTASQTKPSVPGLA
jgi:nitrogen-specific signal transduction histidine kinase